MTKIQKPISCVFSAVPWPGCTAQVECPVLSHHPSQRSPHRPSWDHCCGAQGKDAFLCKFSMFLTCSICLSSQPFEYFQCPDDSVYLPHPLQLQLTQRVPAPQEPVTIIVPIVYDMATGLTQQADIPRQHSSSGAAALLVSNILKRFNELHPARQGETELHCRSHLLSLVGSTEASAFHPQWEELCSVLGLLWQSA